jgi:LuxR family maltose regulon positive regulatory protein
MQTVAPHVGAGAVSFLESPESPMEAVQAGLLNDLHAVSDDVMLVLDDYHVIGAREVQDGMAFLLEHLPPQIHLVIASRADPALPLRVYARGELVEVRAADLRFTPAEAATYLNGTTGLALTAEDVATLEGRTEGGSLPSSWRRFLCRDGTTSQGSSRASPGTTAMSSTTWSRRSYSVRPSRFGTSCCRRRS